MRILTESEITEKNYVQFTESYIVKFWIQNGEFWVQDTIRYYSTKHGAHQAVGKRWEKDFKNKKVQLISIDYQ